MKLSFIAGAGVLALGFFGCGHTQLKELIGIKKTNLTVGLVQKQIYKGMDQPEIIANLGSPNIVTKDMQGQETWVYDKMSSEASYSQSEQFGTLLLIGGSSGSKVTSTSQKTLTVIIKFDEKHLVDKFSYHSTSF